MDGWAHTRGWLVLLALPWLLIVLNDRWIETVQGAIDGWIYYGYFTSLQDHLRAFAGTYYGTRLAWILPGALVHELLPPMAANYVLHLGVYYAALFSIYVTLRRVVGARAALLAAVMVGCYAYFLGAVGWHYTDGAGLAYDAVALACLTAAIDSRRRRLWLAGAGAAFAGSVHTNVVWAIMLPAVAYYYFVTTRESRAGRVLIDWAFALLGAMALTLALSAGAVANGGTFWFFMPSVDFAVNSAPAQDDATWLEMWRRMIGARFLIFPAAALVSAVYFLVAHARETRLARLLAWHYLLACAALVTFDLALGQALTVVYYVSYLIPGLALAGGLLLRDAVRGLSDRQYAGIVAIAVMAFAIPLLPPVAVWLTPASGYRSPAVVAGSLFIVLIAGALAQWRTSAATLAVFTTCAGLVSGATADRRLVPREGEDPARSAYTYAATVAATDAVTALDPEMSARFWYDGRPPLGSVFRSIASTRLWGYRLVGDRFPSLVNPLTKETAALASGDRIAVLSADADPLPEASKALLAAGFDTAVVARREIAAGDLRFHLTLLRAGLDRGLLDAGPLPVSSDVFLEGSAKGAAERVAVDAASNLVQIVTNRSTYDFQVVSRPIALGPGRRYLAEFEVEIPRGGAGFHVVSTKTQAVLATRYWCNPLRQPSRQHLVFETDTEGSVRLALSNCGAVPVVSDFTVKDLQLSAYERRD